MRFCYGGICALTVLASITACGEARAYDLLASVFDFGFVPPDDPDPTLSGVIKIDSETGLASPFIPEGTGGAFVLSDVAVGPHDGLIYVSTQVGQIARFDASGSPMGAFAFFPLTEEEADGVNTLQFTTDGTLYAATGSGIVAKFDPNGTRQPDVATGLTFPSGIAVSPAGDVYVSTGNAGGTGEIVRIDSMGNTTVIGSGTIGGASGLTYLPARGDYNGDNTTDAADLAFWSAAYGSSDLAADGNGDGLVDAADYTIAKDHQGENAQLLVSDFSFAPTGNRIYAYDLVEETGDTLATIPVAFPDPLPDPPTAFPTNFPSEVFLGPDGTLLVSSLGPAQRPINFGSVVEFNRDGSLVEVIQTELPPISGLDIAPPVPASVPEPAAGVLSLMGCLIFSARRLR